MAKEYNVPIDDFKRMASGAKLIELEETLNIFGTPGKPGSIYQLALDGAKIWRNAGVIDKEVNPKDVIDWTVVNQLKK
jgi:hypothetical protein